MDNFQNDQFLFKKERLEQKYNQARANLLIVSAVSAINVILLLLQSGTYFLFSAYIPYVFVHLGLDLTGKYPTEFYMEVYGEEYANMEFLGTPFLVAMTVIAFLMIALYLLSWLFSKNHRVGWLIFALVLFTIDTLLMFMLNGFNVSMILDILFHGWVIFSLISGIVAHNKLAKLPMILPDSFPVPDFGGEEQNAEQGSGEQAVSNSVPLRMANLDVKSRVFLEAESFGHKITYRRVKRVNELVIDGYVYDEYEALVEFEHSLCATIDGNIIEAGTNNRSKTFINVNNVEIASKMRWY